MILTGLYGPDVSCYRPEKIVMRRTDLPLSAAVRRRNYAFVAVCLWCFFVCYYSVPAALAQYRFDFGRPTTACPNSIRGIIQTATATCG